MKTTAALLVEIGKPLEVVELEIPRLKEGQVLVKVHYSGCCHTQVLEVRGYRGIDQWCPHCLGHEGSGEVVDCGPNITKVSVDEFVVLGWIKGVGADVTRSIYDWSGTRVNAGAITTFSKFAVVSENRVTRCPENINLRDATLLGCAAPTGMGAVTNVCNAQVGQTLAVFGVGGIGLCAIAAAVAQNCEAIIGIDVNESKLSLAKRMGATHCINARKTDPILEISDIVSGGLDFAIEASGQIVPMKQALEVVRPQGGVAVIIGNTRAGEMLEIDPKQLNLGKRIFGTWGGDTQPDRDYDKYSEILVSDNFDIDALVSKPYSLNQINQALDDLEAGNVGRPIIDMAL